MRVTVTGGAGFVGSHIVRRLLEAKHEVRVVDDLSKGKPENLEPSTRALLEIIDAAKADYTKTDAVVHAAAYPDVSANWRDPRERERQWTSNAELTFRLLEKVGPGRLPFVLLSTCSVYGPGTYVLETTATRSTSPYAATKIAAEGMVDAYHEAGRVRGFVVRLVNVVGARYGHGHLADFVRQAKEGKIHALDDGRKAKSFVHAGDVADEIAELLEPKHLDAMGPSSPRCFNITSPTRWSWRDSVAVMQARQPKKPIALTWEERRSGWIGDPDDLVVHSQHLGHKPRRSIVAGVNDALADLGW